ncbi:MAG: hypothetical protein ACRDJC_04100 [Thermomicrobiales bacterium]
MHDQDDISMNTKAVLLAVGGAALAALLLVLARRDDKSPQAQAEAAVQDVTKEAKKAAKAAKKKRKDVFAAAAETRDHLADDVKETAASLGVDARTAERDLKAAAWDAQQEAREAEHRLRATGHRVVEDASHLASRFGAEARNLAGEGRERIAHLRHREDAENAVDRELARLRAEVEELRSQIAGTGRKAERDYFGIASRLTGKGAASKDDVAAQAAAAALSQLERALKAKAPELLAARNRAQVIEILQKDLGPTLKESAVHAAMAALGMLETGKERAREAADDVRDVARDLREETRDTSRHMAEDIRETARETADEAEHRAEAIRANGKRRFWRATTEAQEAADATKERIDEAVKAAEAKATEEERHGKAGLFWGGAGLGLALYALLDAERREKVLRMANEASVQVQELVRDLQGYDDEF